MKARKAREDKNGTAKPMTQIVAHISPGVSPSPVRYELQHIDPNPEKK